MAPGKVQRADKGSTSFLGAAKVRMTRLGHRVSEEGRTVRTWPGQQGEEEIWRKRGDNGVEKDL